MARDRIVSPEAAPGDPEDVGAPGASDEEHGSPHAPRPRRLVDFVGQREIVRKLDIALQAARDRGEPTEHLLLHGPPGLGKTTLARLIAIEMGTRCHEASGPALTKGADLVGTLTRMNAGDVLFIDEIHRLPIAVEEFIYSAMEDFRIDFTLDAGLHARTVTYRLKPFTLVGATTRSGLLTGALRSRFGMVHHLRFYDAGELALVLERAAATMGITIDAPAITAIASRSRGTPRVTLRLLRRVRDFAHVRGDGTIDAAITHAALLLEGIDDRGLDALDRAYLRTLADTYDGGPVGVEALAATLGEDSGTFEDVVEPYLLQAGLLARTRQGRRMTDAAVEHLGRTREVDRG